MARPGLQRNRKWPRLVRAIGSEPLARGCLELIWDVAYENGDDYLGNSEDVELAAKWSGKAGALTKALLEAGGEGEPGFIEEMKDRPGRYIVHDLWDHAPDYVARRAAREVDRTVRGETISSLRSRAGKLGAKARWQTDGNCLATDSNGLAKVATPTRAPAPTPTQEDHSSASPPGLNGKAWEKVSEAWERLCVPVGFAKARWTPKQKAAATTRAKEAGWLDAFEAACAFIAKEQFYRGKNDRGWAATLTWMLKPGKAEELAERASTTRARKETPEDAAVRAALEEAERRGAVGTGDGDAGPDGGPGDEGFVGGSPPLPEVPDDVAALSATGATSLGDRRRARELQDAAHVEHGAQHGGAALPGALRLT